MKIKHNQPIDISSEINCAFIRIRNLMFIETDWDKNRKEAAMNFEVTYDFQTMAESVPFIPMIGIRYNYQLAIVKNKRVIINLN